MILLNNQILQIGGWASPNDVLLQNDDTPLPTGKISVEESSWVTAIMVISHKFSFQSFINM